MTALAQANQSDDKQMYLRAIDMGIALAKNAELYEKSKQSISDEVERMLKIVEKWDKRTTRRHPSAPDSPKSSSIESKKIPVETWDNIIGLPRTKMFIRASTTLYQRQRKAFAALGAESDRLILLYGPPGTGKTTIARAIANQLNYDYYELPPSQVFGKYMGDTEKNIREFFDNAITSEKAVILIDEIDAICKKRTGSDHSGSEDRAVTEFLQCIDSLKDYPDVLLIGATNHYSMLDPAIVRRFSLRLCVPLPTKDARRDMIVKFFSQNNQSFLTPEDDVDLLVDKTECFNVSDLLGVINAAKTIPMHDAMFCTKWLEVDGMFEPDPIHGVEMKAEEIPDDKMKLRDPNYNDLVRAIKDVRPTAVMEEVKALYVEAGNDLKDRD